MCGGFVINRSTPSSFNNFSVDDVLSPQTTFFFFCFWPYWSVLAVYHTCTRGPSVGRMRHFWGSTPRLSVQTANCYFPPGIRASRHLPAGSSSDRRSPGAGGLLHHPLCRHVREDRHEEPDFRDPSPGGERLEIGQDSVQIIHLPQLFGGQKYAPILGNWQMGLIERSRTRFSGIWEIWQRKGTGSDTQII